jgi:hypothetical protein
LAKDVKVPSLRTSPRIVEDLLRAGVDITGDEGIEGLIE